MRSVQPESTKVYDLSAHTHTLAEWWNFLLSSNESELSKLSRVSREEKKKKIEIKGAKQSGEVVQNKIKKEKGKKSNQIKEIL